MNNNTRAVGHTPAYNTVDRLSQSIIPSNTNHTSVYDRRQSAKPLVCIVIECIIK
jgi:hypothetical protein